MGCAILPETSRPHAEINVTPLIDVLLIIFMIGLPVVKRDLPLALSSKTTPEVVRTQPVTLCLDAAGSLYLQDVRIGRRQLDHLLRTMAAQQPKPSPRINVREDASYQRVADLMSAGYKAGFTDIGFAGH
ncbi:ExbD/TolR family protein [Pseudofulvimonas gallinarii]|jgi:biopolymer transport protein ExbD|uniref:Biopolymer transport protein ExbD/biopolymer transport protein TolR n=2 Tax=Pseudofulvimonas gallinarii TaxID=634155 RepID=A0A4S3KYX5_9GAMM|nr:biopolymer transporter ExbD [Pseudofulvimonas gallinarii]TCS93532.1 biopolymer transport protein ExbD/biopolymer transport protein TolR [Pseudofulvimonas gallinarii]THD14436.1 hypothetical protein B1808_04030 [Pseudofulvimonas gallinarii]